jgi:hypothetical protein
MQWDFDDKEKIDKFNIKRREEETDELDKWEDE